MPFGIETFSFDLFGISRRPAKVDRSTSSEISTPGEETEARQSGEGAKSARDRENFFFWGMFPVL